MQVEPKITFRNLDSSDAVKQQIEERIAELEHVFGRIVACNVTVETANPRRRKGRLYHVTVHLSVPGGEIAVKRDPADDHRHEDIRVTVHDAFDAARRQLDDHARRARGQVKAH